MLLSKPAKGFDHEGNKAWVVAELTIEAPQLTLNALMHSVKIKQEL